MNIITRIIRRFRPAPSVNSITAGFAKQVKQLEALHEAKIAEGFAIEDQINNLKEAQIDADHEADVAAQIADRLAFFVPTSN